jgi:hypothetical protein
MYKKRIFSGEHMDKVDRHLKNLFRRNISYTFHTGRSEQSGELFIVSWFEPTGAM